MVDYSSRKFAKGRQRTSKVGWFHPTVSLSGSSPSTKWIFYEEKIFRDSVCWARYVNMVHDSRLTFYSGPRIVALVKASHGPERRCHGEVNFGRLRLAPIDGPFC